MKCSYCGTGLINGDRSCPKCGAPFSTKYRLGKTPLGTCICGKILSDKTEYYEIPNLICHNCFKTFAGSFKGQYVCDRTYNNGQITHLYATVGLECPHCGAVFNGHEFYHGLLASEGVEKLVSRALRAYEKV